jgi:hypothetical protein
MPAGKVTGDLFNIHGDKILGAWHKLLNPDQAVISPALYVSNLCYS